MMSKFSALRTVQTGSGGPVTMFLAYLPAGFVLENADVDAWREDNPEGYQRPLSQSRLRDVAHYVTKEEGIFPNTILFGVRSSDGLNFEPQGEPVNGSQAGTISLKEGEKMWVIDGQHRLYGLKSAVERDGATEMLKYPLPVSILAGVDIFGEMRHFYLVNTRQKGVSTDMVDLHIDRMRERHGVGMRGLTGRSTSNQEKEYRRSRAVKIARILRDSPGVWQGAIRLPGEEPLAKHLQRLHPVVASLEPAMKDTYTSGIPDQDLAKLLAAYWGAIAEAWPQAFEAPDDYRIVHTAGLYALHMVFPDVMTRCRDSRDFSKEKMRTIFTDTGISSEFWHKERGDVLTAGTSMGSLRTLATFLREQLPPVALPGLG